jgi:hypothetical protein
VDTVVLCASVINGRVGCGAGMASAFRASSRAFQLKRQISVSYDLLRTPPR